jgi:hypothetical protein
MIQLINILSLSLSLSFVHSTHDDANRKKAIHSPALGFYFSTAMHTSIDPSFHHQLHR